MTARAAARMLGAWGDGRSWCARPRSSIQIVIPATQGAEVDPRLRLMGTRSAVELTFFPLMTRSGKVSRDVLYIDGRFYLEED